MVIYIPNQTAYTSGAAAMYDETEKTRAQAWKERADLAWDLPKQDQCDEFVDVQLVTASLINLFGGDDIGRLCSYYLPNLKLAWSQIIK